MAYGTMGGDGQPQTQAALFTRHVSFRQDLATAIERPRWLLGRTWGSPQTSLRLESRFEESLIYHRTQGNQDGIALALNRLGELARLAGDDDQAGMLYEESLAICRAIGRTIDVASALA